MSCFWGTPFTPVEGACGFALVLALSQMMEHGLDPFGCADLHPRRNPLDRQGRFAPQPGSDGQPGGGAVRSPKSKVQGPRSKVQSPKLGADEERGAWQGCSEPPGGSQSGRGLLHE